MSFEYISTFCLFFALHGEANKKIQYKIAVCKAVVPNITSHQRVSKHQCGPHIKLSDDAIKVNPVCKLRKKMVHSFIRMIWCTVLF